MLEILAFAVVIGVLVFVHELGHLLAAKSVDIEVPRFSIGFGPRVAGFRWGETEYVISALPLGGYVRMAGMEDTAALEGGAEPDRAPSSRDYDAKPLWARAMVVSAGVIMNFLFAILVIAGVAFFFGEPHNPSTRVDVTGATAETAPALAAVPPGAELTRVAGQPVEGWTDVVEALSDAPAGPVTLEFADLQPVTLTIPTGETARLELLQTVQPFVEPVIGSVEPGTPAARVGLQVGDRVVSANGAPVRSWSELVQVVRAHPERPLDLTLERQGQQVSVEVTPVAQSGLNEEMERVQYGQLGVAPQTDEARRPVALGEALRIGATSTWNTSVAIVALLGDLFTGEASPRSLGGPLAIGQLSGQAARFGLEAFFGFMAVLSINLAVLNLLPIPVLDGGQLLFLGVEAVRGRPLSVEQRIRLSNVGLIIVVGIMVWAITNDFLRFFGI